MEHGERQHPDYFSSDDDVPAKTVLYGEPQVPPLSMLKTDKVLKKFSAYLENLPPLPEVNSLGGGLKVETILDMVQNTSHDSFLLIKFKNKDEPELIPLDLALQKVPYLLSKFYKEYVCMPLPSRVLSYFI
ncbi:uncharacterized protein Dana_GF28077 [Drosophila ananassae]|uniref:Chromo shadow domain-containing protein n=1 Tax=Drosophila ananassae TaxID=7217 RepID=A0A0P8XII0_DROAN|nr:uncharacterized protein LOC26515486 [Drosophila ananassae]KPU74629.1 uncharacterized protein Dana_GF28077 [Drosophila ananassae]